MGHSQPPDEGIRICVRTPLTNSRSLTKDGWPISRSFFARCGMPLLFRS